MSTLSLVFDFANEQKFSLDADQVVRVYRQCFEETSVKTIWVEGMLPLWLSGYQRGDKRFRQAALAPLKEYGWQWPWFDEWRKHFVEHNTWPWLWLHLQQEAKDGRKALHQGRVELLDHVITSRCMMIVRSSQIPKAGVARRGWSFHSTCEVSAKIAESRASRADVFDPSTLPPYFPGDQTGIRVNPR